MSRTSTAKAHRMWAQAVASVRMAAIVEIAPIAAVVEAVRAVVAVGDEGAGVVDVTAAAVVVDATVVVAAGAGIKTFATDLHGFTPIND